MRRWQAQLGVAAVAVVIGTVGLVIGSKGWQVGGFLILVVGIGLGCGSVQRRLRQSPNRNTPPKI